MDLYQEQIVDLAKHPLHRRQMTDATVTHSGVNVTCGDHVRIYLKFSGQSEEMTIAEVSWEGEGCAISVAAVSLLAEELPGKTVVDLKALQNQNMFKLLGVDSLGPARVKCAVLCLETAQAAAEKL